MELKALYTSLALRYNTNENLAEELWQELEKAYGAKGRHYHNLIHLENMYAQLLEVKEHIADWDTLLFSLFYHDVIYNASKKDNEEKSAALAVKRLTEIQYPENKMQLCFEQIMATKKHEASSDPDTNYFIDADLSILGTSRENYLEYCKNIRKEYSIYPDFLYNPGRKKALVHFLEMRQIFKTPHFQEKYEADARENITYEITLL
jgi:predicted metal-dependent HD superfamily phosphohydrolase